MGVLGNGTGFALKKEVDCQFYLYKKKIHFLRGSFLVLFPELFRR